jgi:hypothetical protein
LSREWVWLAKADLKVKRADMSSVRNWEVPRRGREIIRKENRRGDNSSIRAWG